MKFLLTLVSFLFSLVLNATPINQIVVFGDSLSDNGNLYELMKHQLPPSPPYFEGRFSNGPVWFEHFVSKYFPENTAAHYLNYAYGGAGVEIDNMDDEENVITLKKEIDTYLLSHEGKAAPDSLYVIWIGANNYLAVGEGDETGKTLDQVNQGITQNIKRLVAKGAKHIFLINLPDLSLTPAAAEFKVVSLYHYLTVQHNLLLKQSFDALKKLYPEVEWVFYDLYTDFNQVVAHPEEYGFTNVSDMCIDLIPNGLKPSILKMSALAKGLEESACTGYVFFDLVHPTASAHQVLADKVRAALDESKVQIS